MTRPRKKDRHLPPCVHFKHGAYYYVKNGKWEPLGRELGDALDAYSKKIETPKGGMAELIDRVMVEIRPNLKPSTLRQYNAAAERLKAYLVEFTPQQVKPKHVAAIKVALSDTPNMANRLLSVLRTVFAQALEWQLVESNPCVGVKRHVESKRGRYITDEEFLAIYAKANTQLQIIMDLCYLTAQRIGDVMAIRLADLNNKDGIPFKPEKTDGSTQAKLLVKWTPDLLQVVGRAKALHYREGKVRTLTTTLLINRLRRPPTYAAVRDLWKRACEAAGVQDAHIHDLRAKSLTDAKSEGHNPQALAAHSTPAMTERYIRLRETPQVDGPSFRRLLDEEKKG